MAKLDIKNLMAQTREIARQPSKQAEKAVTEEPLAKPEIEDKPSDISSVSDESDIKEKKAAQKQTPVKEKKQPTAKAQVQAYTDSPLINAIKEYDPGTETQRMTYIINEANYRILSAIKAESKTSIMCLINFFLDEALKGRSEEINKLIHKQYKNLKL